MKKHLNRRNYFKKISFSGAALLITVMLPGKLISKTIRKKNKINVKIHPSAVRRK